MESGVELPVVQVLLAITMLRRIQEALSQDKEILAGLCAGSAQSQTTSRALENLEREFTCIGDPRNFSSSQGLAKK